MHVLLESIVIGFLALFLAIQRIIEIIVHFSVQKILDHLLSNNIVYNVAVEDPRQDKEILNIQNDDVIAMITTGSCNVLDRAIDNPKHIYAIDYNKNQNSLLELRLACIKNLEYEEMWQIWGDKQDTEFFQKVYESRIKKDLSMQARNFWDKNWKNLKDWHYYGSVGSTIKIFLKMFRLLGLGEFFTKITESTCTFEQQKQEYEKIKPRFRTLCNISWATVHLVAPFLGVPPRQLSIIEGNLMFNMFDHIFNNTHLASENYIVFAYSKGTYIKESCPRYLTPEGFSTLKNNLKKNPDMISIHTSMLSDVLTKEVKDEELTVTILLDSMDWMNDNMVKSQLKILKQKLHPTKGRILFRSASDVLTHPDLISSLDYDTELVDQVKRKLPCLLGSYPGTFLGRFNDKTSSDIANMPFPNNTLVDDLRVFKQMYFGKLSGTKEEQEKRLESFYKLQADKYDGYRQYMLHGRSAMVSSIPLDESNPIVWADFGCGTGSNFELIDKKYIKKIYGIDLCQSLLDVAKERINRMKISDKVELIKADASQNIKGIQKKSVDVITFSYSLTMIPDWKASLQVALGLLKPGGYLAISDFTVDPNHSFYSNFFWKSSFSRDYVHLNPEHKSYLQKIVDPKMYFIGEGGFPYIPFLKSPYHVFLGQKRDD